MTRVRRIVLFLAILLAGLSGCAGSEVTEGRVMRDYYDVLKATDPANMKLVGHGTDLEKSAIERFKHFYTVFSAERIKEALGGLYAEDAYFEDGLRQVRGRQNIEEYFLSTTTAFDSCTFDLVDVAWSEKNYYFRWVMHLKLKRYGDSPLEVPGLSHVRFDEKGQVVFHRDYWETAELYQRFPVLGTMIRWVKKRI